MSRQGDRLRWLAMIDHTLKEPHRPGLRFGIHNCDGFSQSGGPWICTRKDVCRKDTPLLPSGLPGPVQIKL